MEALASLGQRKAARLPHRELVRRPAGRSRQGLPVDLSASVAAWLELHAGSLVECHRHNGLARLTAAACARRYRRAVARWVDSLNIDENSRQILRLSFAICATCPVGAYHAVGSAARAAT